MLDFGQAYISAPAATQGPWEKIRKLLYGTGPDAALYPDS